MKRTDWAYGFTVVGIIAMVCATMVYGLNLDAKTRVLEHMIDATRCVVRVGSGVEL